MSEIAAFLSWHPLSQAPKIGPERMTMSNFTPVLVVPDSLLAKEATDLLREHSTDLLFNHSMRVYFFAAEQGHQRKLRFDPELLYVAATFHDFGLLKNFSSSDQRFERRWRKRGPSVSHGR
jgi:hypothetical protein